MKKNSCVTTIYRNGHEHDRLYTVAGQWTEELTITDVGATQNLETYTVHEHQITALTVANIAQQYVWESRDRNC